MRVDIPVVTYLPVKGPQHKSHADCHQCSYAVVLGCAPVGYRKLPQASLRTATISKYGTARHSMAQQRTAENSRAEQSRAEQSRAEQSRAEHSMQQIRKAAAYAQHYA